MIVFLSGALTATYLIAAVFFLKFWRKTRDRLFSLFALAFTFFALNQVAAVFLDLSTERGSFAYLLRITGFVLILFAIIEKNRTPKKNG
ncbi:MAG TPA: DUF5985 family protein [Chthoniobacterales bacterium]